MTEGEGTLGLCQALLYGGRMNEDERRRFMDEQSKNMIHRHVFRGIGGIRKCDCGAREPIKVRG